MRPVSVHVADADYQRFKALAALEGRPVAALIRLAMAEYLKREQRSGRSVLDIPPHASGAMLHGWSRSDLYDEMLDR